ncbi:MAG: 16S rRNA (adenine(1518)-N(6)/adenine(1519)-N(6))-dimethyltransferase RsmA [Syntrophobacteraceae bacterium]|nr:16S rRNA (adenine(1518)-N(6)/adenine(1519)-N(6))-dimethyltransferase RsmA [Syntrophobacteraceae bacterium]
MPNFLTPAQYFKQYGSRPLKRFGQHFLSQPATAQKIVQSAEILACDAVVEIGPGLGALTQFIIEQAEKTHLIELDRVMVEYLSERVPAQTAIYRQDALAFDFKDLSLSLGKRLVVLGNLPYNISSPLVFTLLEAFPAIDRAVFMVQKEVGIRLAAPPGSKDYGVLSVLLGIYAEVSKLFSVGPSQFHPPPKVDSLVLRIDFSPAPPDGDPGFDFVRKLVSKAFQQRRKTLANSLAGVFGLSPEKLKRGFEQAQIDPKRRPETLSPLEFLALARSFLPPGA